MNSTGPFLRPDDDPVPGDDETPIMDEEDALRSEYAEREFVLTHTFGKVLLALHPHASMQVECAAFVMHMGKLFDIRKQTDIARRHGNGHSAKANVNKYVKDFQRKLQMAAADGQRTNGATKAMHEARNSQLK